MHYNAMTSKECDGYGVGRVRKWDADGDKERDERDAVLQVLSDILHAGGDRVIQLH